MVCYEFYLNGVFQTKKYDQGINDAGECSSVSISGCTATAHFAAGGDVSYTYSNNIAIACCNYSKWFQGGYYIYYICAETSSNSKTIYYDIYLNDEFYERRNMHRWFTPIYAEAYYEETDSVRISIRPYDDKATGTNEYYYFPPAALEVGAATTQVDIAQDSGNTVLNIYLYSLDYLSSVAIGPMQIYYGDTILATFSYSASDPVGIRLSTAGKMMEHDIDVRANGGSSTFNTVYVFYEDQNLGTYYDDMSLLTLPTKGKYMTSDIRLYFGRSQE